LYTAITPSSKPTWKQQQTSDETPTVTDQRNSREKGYGSGVVLTSDNLAASFTCGYGEC